jgi:hypothetical protein
VAQQLEVRTYASGFVPKTYFIPGHGRGLLVFGSPSIISSHGILWGLEKFRIPGEVSTVWRDPGHGSDFFTRSANWQALGALPRGEGKVDLRVRVKEEFYTPRNWAVYRGPLEVVTFRE